MPPKVRITREQIVETALELVRSQGMDAVNAREIARTLGCSTQPVFSNFASMEGLKQAVLTAADGRYQRAIREAMEKGEYPAYKAAGMAYIGFARQEPALFKLLFMRDRTGERIPEDRESIRAILDVVMKNLSITEDEAYLLHLELWLYVHGIATMLATGYLDWEEEFISRALTDAYQGLKHRFTEGK